MTAEYLSTAELARYTGTSPSFWVKRRLSGDTPQVYRVGRLAKYRRSDVDAWIAARDGADKE